MTEQEFQERLQEIRGRLERAKVDDLSWGVAAEEPDTWLIGNHGILWCRIVGVPDSPARPRAEFFARAPEDVDFLLGEVNRFWAAAIRRRGGKEQGT